MQLHSWRALASSHGVSSKLNRVIKNFTMMKREEITRVKLRRIMRNR
jgi:hypothetical protein